MAEATGAGTPAFVTGGTGFVGGALVRELHRRGREVRALVRTPEPGTELAPGVEVVHGDLFAGEQLRRGMRDRATVFHVAGVNTMCLRDPAPMLHTNVEGTASVLRAAASAGAGRVILTSTAATVGEAEGAIGDEATTHRGSFLSGYERSKFLAEERARDLAAELGLDLVTVNPSSVQGPGRVGGSARLLLDLVSGRLRTLVETWLSFVDIDDCTAGHLAAEERGEPGRRYLLSGATLSTRGAVALLRTVWGLPGSVRFVPRSLARATGTLSGVAERLSGRDLPVCPELVRTLLHGHRYDGERAVRELGLRYTPVDETLGRTLAWYAARGLAPGPGPGRGDLSATPPA